MKISKEKRDKISEQILFYLFNLNPKAEFTSHIAKEIARDEEFIKKILISLKNKKLVIEIKKNPKGIKYERRTRWKLSESAYNFYKKLQIEKNTSNPLQ
jgi:predicted transcriptional regulator with HTH domain